MKQKHFSLSPNTLVELLLAEKIVAHQLIPYQHLNVSALQVNLWEIVMDCVGLPLGQLEVIDSEYWEAYQAEYVNLEASVTTLQHYLNHLNQQFHHYHLAYPKQLVIVMKKQRALARILEQDFNWKYTVKSLETHDTKSPQPDAPQLKAINLKATDLNQMSLNTVNLLPLVCTELGKKYRSEYEDEIVKRTPTGSASEYLEVVDWIQQLKT